MFNAHGQDVIGEMCVQQPQTVSKVMDERQVFFALHILYSLIVFYAAHFIQFHSVHTIYNITHNHSVFFVKLWDFMKIVLWCFPSLQKTRIGNNWITLTEKCNI